MTPKSNERGLKDLLKDIATAIGELLNRFLRWITRDFPWCPKGSGFHHWHRIGKKVVHEDNGSFHCRDYVRHFTTNNNRREARQLADCILLGEREVCPFTCSDRQQVRGRRSSQRP